MNFINETVKKRTYNLIKTINALTCKETNSLERIDNIQYYFGSLKSWLVTFLKENNIDQSIINEINKLNLLDCVSEFNHTVNFNKMNQKFIDLIIISENNLKYNIERLNKKLHDFNDLLNESLHNHKACGC